MNLFVPVPKMKSEFVRILINSGFTTRNAELCAGIFTENSLDGIYSHGVNRFSKFIMYVRKGYIIPQAVPTLVHSAGALEQWNGNLGPGPLNATHATERAVSLSEKNGTGMVALANTNHWMRGGTYGWQAVKKDCAFIGWTNTEPNMPVWGAIDTRLGNNPVVFAVPFGNEAIVLDSAMSQYSYGKMELFRMEGKKLPFPGGFDSNGKMTDDPYEILLTKRALPAGYWKGAGLSMLLDILAAILSAGLSTHEIRRMGAEFSLSQVFIAINLKKLSNHSSINDQLNRIIRDLKKSLPANDETSIRYPGEQTPLTRKENLENGIPVNEAVWKEILSL